MSNYKKSSSLLDQDKHVVEYTSGQLIMAICLFLMVALACFVLGMYVGPPGPSETSRIESSATKPDAKKPVPPPESSPKEGRQTLPDPRVLSAAKTAAPNPAVAPTARDTGGPRSVELPPLDPGAAANTPVATPAAVQPPVAPATPALKPEAEPQAQQAPSPESAAQTLAQSMKPSAAPYAIQLIAFSAVDTAKAEEYKVRLEKNTDLKPEVVPSKDGKWVRVLVGAYPDRASAEKARDEIGKKAEFRKCFVQAREQ